MLVLEPEEDRPVADRRVVDRLELGIGSLELLEQAAQVAGLERLAPVEGIHDHAAVAVVHAYQEMTGEGQPVHRPALGPGGVDIEDAEAHGQAQAAVDDLKEVRVLGRIVALGIAGIAVRFEEHGVEVAAPALQRLVGPDARRQVRAEPADMGAVARQRRTRQVEGAEQQRAIGQIDRVVRKGADRAEHALDRRAGHQGVAGRRGSSLATTWATMRFTSSMLRAWSITRASSSSFRAIPMR